MHPVKPLHSPLVEEDKIDKLGVRVFASKRFILNGDRAIVTSG